MSGHQVDTRDGRTLSADRLLAIAAAVLPCDLHGGGGMVGDLLLDDQQRLDERTRFVARNRLDAILSATSEEIRDHAAQLLESRGEGDLAKKLRSYDGAARLLRQAPAFRDNGLVAEILDSARLDLIGADLPVQAPADADEASLLAQLVDSSDRLVSSAAVAMLSADSRRRAMNDQHGLTGADLDAETYYRLVWLVAAALRLGGDTGAQSDPIALDHALIESARRSLAAHDEGERAEASAARLAQALDAKGDRLAALMEAALADRRIILFTALFARALHVPYRRTRALLLADPEFLWVALRALDFPRETLAGIGYALSEADKRRDVERFASHIDVVMALSRDDAIRAIAPDMLDDGYRDALTALGGKERA
ncbi:DUF2336 domain-containing protein [Stakelama sp. CBK3Z-3]|uniref:DUF2336 domain-containing protein n=1 Tax=Stakelama flava TaxID=2860338 RepID=A0ABS6XIM2_9SPHN|nr:DUF2336 domain-containing protein [Stakelama flava]MBW4329310.1 DUF2336 domain-containing protein [Stakelama flava]